MESFKGKFAHMENRNSNPVKNKYAENPIVIKKYANRRLYNTETSTYITLEDLCAMVKRDENFIVYDAKSGDDITRSVLTQVIMEQESKNHSLLPTGFLRKVISFYDDSMHEILPQYLDASIDSFAKNQDNFRKMFKNAMGGAYPYQQLEEITKRNISAFQSALGNMFDPFGVFTKKDKDSE